MSMSDAFTEDARRSVALAQEQARRFGNTAIEPEHVVLGILTDAQPNETRLLLERHGITAERFAHAAGLSESSARDDRGELVFAPDTKRLIELAFRNAERSYAKHVSSANLIVGAIAMPGSLAARGLAEASQDAAALMRDAVLGAGYKPELSTLRSSYERAELEEGRMLDDPLAELRVWLDAAIAARTVEPNAFCLATVALDGAPSARMVLLRGLDARGVVFYTNYESRKGAQLRAQPLTAATFWWGALERQVRLEGTVEPLSDEESDAYFASRPRGHRLSAWASEQSRTIESRALLDERMLDFETRFEGEDVPRPHSWGGFLIKPSRVEFWQGRKNRMHDRIEYSRSGSQWRRQRLQP